jgi:hypothetical protein
MAITARAALLTALIGLCPVAALAQATPPAGTAGSTGPAPIDTAVPAASASASAAPVVPATGFGWSTKPRKPGSGRTRTPMARAKSQSPDVLLPGFETLADGSTRLFVLMSRPVQVETKPARGTLTYVLKGAHVDKRNNYNPLVTVHFNTPVTSARLVPHGSDLWFVVDLRASTTPAVTMDAAKDGGAMLRIEFPKGDYLPSMGSALPPPSNGPAAAPAGPAATPIPPTSPTSPAATVAPAGH